MKVKGTKAEVKDIYSLNTCCYATLTPCFWLSSDIGIHNQKFVYLTIAKLWDGRLSEKMGFTEKKKSISKPRKLRSVVLSLRCSYCISLLGQNIVVK